MTPRTPLFAVALLCSSAAVAASTTYDCAVSPASTFSQTTDVAMPMVGTWIGNYDATTNPTGTKTIPGLFGGSGNNPIPFNGTYKPRITISNAHPAGTFGFALDTELGTAAVDGLALDVLNGQSGTIANSIVLTFSTFRTQQPSSTFFGVSNFNVPLTNDTISSATLTQTAPAVGTAVANGTGGWDITVAVPVDLAVSGTAAGTPFTQNSPAVFALTGTATQGPNGIDLSLQSSLNETAPVAPPPPMVGVPFPMPTVFPAGYTASLVMDATFSAGTSTTTMSITVAASGTPAAPDADLNGDGVVGGADLGILLALWGTNDPIADIDRNGVVDGPDLGILLAAWN